MRRLYLQIYVTIVLSLALFIVVAGFMWRQISESSTQNQALEVV